MEALIVLFLIVGLVELGSLALIAGADSRPGYGDDHRRPVAP
jgi:hypothetical protein